MNKIKLLISAMVIVLAAALFVAIVTAPIDPKDYTPEERITFLEEEVDRCQDANRSLGLVVDAYKNATPWPTPYPSGAGITEETCEEYRYSDEAILTIFEGWWNSETGEYADDYELTEFLHTATGYSVASHNCSLYDPSFDDDHFYWSQRAYFIIDILENRFYEERYLAPEPMPTLSANCETWRFDKEAPPVLIESNADMAALTLRYAVGVHNIKKCSDIDASFNEDYDLYFNNMFETLDMLTSWLIQEEADG